MAQSKEEGSGGLWVTALAALGVVFGDIGTSPLYTIRECFSEPYGLNVNEPHLLGILSLIFWSLVVVIVVKYIFWISKANNNGEGGIIALLSMLMPKPGGTAIFRSRYVILIGLVGCALLFGDGVITPSLTVLSALEGLEVATPIFQPYILPLSVAILIAIFWAQRGGTARIGALFGPLLLLWFLSIAAVAIPWLLAQPRVFMAISPYYAVSFFMENGSKAFFVLGAVVLCVTGGEALYADMGHFGRRPIKYAWYCVVLPSLVLNYFGQGALILDQGPSALANPFFKMVPPWFLYPMVLIATIAAIIASQALITGLFSVTHQTIQLGYLPRMQIIHTSERTEGQIYLPGVNRLMLVCCIFLVAMFRSSSNLTGAYGIAVTGTMVCTTGLFYLVTTRLWKWSHRFALLVTAPIMLVDLVFFTSNIAKFWDGGWFPIMVAVLVLIVMLTWREGRKLLSQAMLAKALPLDTFIALIRAQRPYRVPGTAMVMTANRDIAPPVLLHHLKHNQVLHEQVVLVTVLVKHQPYVPADDRLEISTLGEGLVRAIARYGYIQRPNVSELIRLSKKFGLEIDKKQVSFYLGRETLLSTGPSHMAKWRKQLFSFLSKNAQSATSSFRIPPDQVVEIGLQLEI
jgi:KUP system potassium uptake protein